MPQYSSKSLDKIYPESHWIYNLYCSDKLIAQQVKTLVLLLVESDTIKKEKLQELKGLKKFEEPLDIALEMRKVNQNWLQKRAEDFIRVLTKYI